ncbi:MAG: DUF2442 domain-containing protein [Burkholderiales bacterium]|nr:DUF2442 domain-containing protein [Burkholderiales bacterium]
MTGAVNSKAEFPHVSRHCVWLLVGNEELAMSFVDFPWFKKATMEQLTNVERASPDHLYWPDLDVDLPVESFRNPVAFPHGSWS